MGRKTKKEKLKSDHRHVHTSPLSSPTYSLKIPLRTQKAPKDQAPAINTTYLYQDLLKSICITTGIFALEGILFWVFERGGMEILMPIVTKF